MGQVTGLPQDMKRHQSNQPRRLWTNAAPAALRNAGSNSMPGSMPTSGWSPPDKPRGVPRLLHQVCQLRLSVSALLLLPPCRPSGPAAHVSGAPGTHCQGCLQLGAPGRA
eukprot:1156473-Pelagomonas_calceolata.AAC.3